MTSTTSGSRITQAMSAFMCSIFPALAEVPAGSRKAAAGKAGSPALPREVSLPRSGLQQAMFQALHTVSLASAMACLLVAYNLRDTIAPQAAQAIMRIMG